MKNIILVFIVTCFFIGCKKEKVDCDGTPPVSNTANLRVFYKSSVLYLVNQRSSSVTTIGAYLQLLAGVKPSGDTIFDYYYTPSVKQVVQPSDTFKVRYSDFYCEFPYNSTQGKHLTHSIDSVTACFGIEDPNCSITIHSACTPY